MKDAEQTDSSDIAEYSTENAVVGNADTAIIETEKKVISDRIDEMISDLTMIRSSISRIDPINETRIHDITNMCCKIKNDISKLGEMIELMK